MQRRRIYIASVLDTATGQTDILSFVWTTYWLPKTGFGNYSHQDSNWSILFCVLKFQSDFLTCINSHHFSEAAAFRALFKLDWRRWYWWRYAKAYLPRGWHKRHCFRGEKKWRMEPRSLRIEPIFGQPGFLDFQCPKCIGKITGAAGRLAQRLMLFPVARRMIWLYKII